MASFGENFNDWGEQDELKVVDLIESDPIVNFLHFDLFLQLFDNSVPSVRLTE